MCVKQSVQRYLTTLIFYMFYKYSVRLIHTSLHSNLQKAIKRRRVKFVNYGSHACIYVKLKDDICLNLKFSHIVTALTNY